MKLRIFVFFAALVVSQAAMAADYHVAQTGAGSGNGLSYDNRASLATFLAGSGVFGNLGGHTVWFYGALLPASGPIVLPSGTSGNIATYRGDAPGHPRAMVSAHSSHPGIRINNSRYLTVQGFDIVLPPGQPSSGIIGVCNAGQSCTDVTIEDNYVDVPGDNDVGPPALIEYGIYLDGGWKNVNILRNHVVGRSTWAKDGIVLFNSQTDNLGHLENNRIAYNQVHGFFHAQIMVVVNYDDAGSSINGLYIHDNITSSHTAWNSRRAYGRGIVTGAFSPHVYNVYVYRNIMGPHRAPGQYHGTNIFWYKNIFYRHASICGPDMEAWGCTEWNACIPGESRDYFGAEKQWYYGSGQGVVTGINSANTRNYFFQNTVYDTAESAFQTRLSTYARHHVSQNIFLNTANAAIGTWTAEGSGSDRCFKWGTSGTQYTAANPYGDSVPPGSGQSHIDVPIGWWRTDNTTNSLIAKNVIFGNPQFPNVMGRALPDSQRYTVAQMEATFTSASTLLATGNLGADPLLESPQSGDFRPKPGSPAIDIGFLAQITSNPGTGTTFIVNEPGYLGAPGELVKTQGGQEAVLVSADYVTGQVVVDRPISWTQNEGISLHYFGQGPDAGAIEFEPRLSGAPGDVGVSVQ